MVKPLSHNIFKTLLNCFTGVNLYLQFLAVLLTYIISASGLDWKYFLFFRGTDAFSFLFPAVFIGFFVPIILPLALLIIGKLKENRFLLNVGYATGQAVILGWAISSFYKVFTGRPPPPETFGATSKYVNLINNSKIFNFGFYRGGIFNGWPSSHTTVSVALSMTLLILYPKSKAIKILAIVYALYVGIGVSVSIHWLSDFVAGAIIGIIIGLSVGESFSKRNNAKQEVSSY